MIPAEVLPLPTGPDMREMKVSEVKNGIKLFGGT
jgi:hypothetical protein